MGLMASWSRRDTLSYPTSAFKCHIIGVCHLAVGIEVNIGFLLAHIFLFQPLPLSYRMVRTCHIAIDLEVSIDFFFLIFSFEIKKKDSSRRLTYEADLHRKYSIPNPFSRELVA